MRNRRVNISTILTIFCFPGVACLAAAETPTPVSPGVAEQLAVIGSV